MWWQAWIMIGLLLVFAISLFITWYIPVWEWALAIVYVNYFTLHAFVNPFYDSVEIPSKKDEEKTKDMKQC